MTVVPQNRYNQGSSDSLRPAARVVRGHNPVIRRIFFAAPADYMCKYVGERRQPGLLRGVPPAGEVANDLGKVRPLTGGWWTVGAPSKLRPDCPCSVKIVQSSAGLNAQRDSDSKMLIYPVHSGKYPATSDNTGRFRFGAWAKSTERILSACTALRGIYEPEGGAVPGDRQPCSVTRDDLELVPQ